MKFNHLFLSIIFLQCTTLCKSQDKTEYVSDICFFDSIRSAKSLNKKSKNLQLIYANGDMVGVRGKKFSFEISSYDNTFLLSRVNKSKHYVVDSLVFFSHTCYWKRTFESIKLFSNDTVRRIEKTDFSEFQFTGSEILFSIDHFYHKNEIQTNFTLVKLIEWKRAGNTSIYNYKKIMERYSNEDSAKLNFFAKYIGSQFR